MGFKSNENWERNKRWAFWEIFAATKDFLFFMIPINQWGIKSEQWKVQKNYESGFGCAFWLAEPLSAVGEIKFRLKPFVCNGEMRIQMKKWSTKCEYQMQHIDEILLGDIF